MYTAQLFSILLNEDIVNIKKPDRMCLLTFVVDEFSGLILHPSKSILLWLEVGRQNCEEILNVIFRNLHPYRL